MKIIINCLEIGISHLVEAVQDKANQCLEIYNKTEWAELKKYYYAQQTILHNILIQIAKQVNEGIDINDG